MTVEFDSQRDRVVAESLGMTLVEFRQKYAPWRLPAAVIPAAPACGGGGGKGKPTPTRRAHVYERDLGLCRYCGYEVEADGLRMFTVDHVKPRWRGGKNGLANLVTACADCNSRKGPRSLSNSGLTLLPIGTRADPEPERLYLKARRAHQRDHWRTDGAAKVGYPSADAITMADFLTRRDGIISEAFPCPECSEWHVRILPGWRKRLRRREADLDDALRLELGERVMPLLHEENVGRQRYRRDRLGRRWNAVRRRQRQRAIGWVRTSPHVSGHSAIEQRRSVARRAAS